MSVDTKPDQEAIRERGYFWWSDQPIPLNLLAPEGGVHGLLEISADGSVSLTLDSVLSASPFEIFQQGQAIKRNILGILDNENKRVLLLELTRRGGTLKIGGGRSRESFIALYCLIGSSEVIQWAKAKTFYAMSVDLSTFDEFFSPVSISISENKFSTTIKYRRRKAISLALREGSIQIQFHLASPRNGVNRTHQISLREETHLLCKFKFSSIEMLVKEFKNLEDLFLLTFGTQRGFPWPNIFFRKKSFPAKLYFQRLQRSSEKQNWQTTVLPFKEVIPYLADIIDKWRELRENFGSGIYMYLGTRRGLKSYIENDFSNMAMGLEALHRALGMNQVNASIRNKIDRIVSEVTRGKDKRWLLAVLKAEPTLTERIFDLFSTLPLPISKQRLLEFSDECSCHRNDLSHFGATRAAITYQEFIDRLVDLNRALGVLYHLKILQLIGVKDESLSWIFENGYQSFAMKMDLWTVGLLAEDPREVDRAATFSHQENLQKMIAASNNKSV